MTLLLFLSSRTAGSGGGGRRGRRSGRETEEEQGVELRVWRSAVSGTSAVLVGGTRELQSGMGANGGRCGEAGGVGCDQGSARW
jgi:hypothetical protein